MADISYEKHIQMKEPPKSGEYVKQLKEMIKELDIHPNHHKLVFDIVDSQFAYINHIFELGLMDPIRLANIGTLVPSMRKLSKIHFYNATIPGRELRNLYIAGGKTDSRNRRNMEKGQGSPEEECEE